MSGALILRRLNNRFQGFWLLRMATTAWHCYRSHSLFSCRLCFRNCHPPQPPTPPTPASSADSSQP